MIVPVEGAQLARAIAAGRVGWGQETRGSDATKVACLGPYLRGPHPFASSLGEAHARIKTAWQVQRHGRVTVTTSRISNTPWVTVSVG